MSRPHIICHMVTSIDGRVTGEFLSHPDSAAAAEVYYELNRAFRGAGAGGFICGRVTMEESFTGGYFPDLSQYRGALPGWEDFWPTDAAKAAYHAIAFDPKGKLGWRSAQISDSDPGYDGSRVVEVLSESADPRYLAYLRELGIPYILAGKTGICVQQALEKLHRYIPAQMLVLEGGSIINGHFLRAGCVDELSLVQAPVCGGPADKPLFSEGDVSRFSLQGTEPRDGALILRYRKEE